MFFIPLGDRVFDTRMILFQIVTLQLAHYITLGILIMGVDFVLGVKPTVEQFFSYKAVNVSNRIGIATMISFFLNALSGSLLLFVVVQRSQKCLDFTITIYIVHFFICVFYKAFPVYWEWWVCTIICIVAMITLGEYICYKREIRDIPITQSAPEDKNQDDVSITIEKDPERTK
ncbi:sys [Acrasis kona]|uniref:Sys n=1 Tax=Acrasis kona TaxID=1008807 RepID=A0AAW2Z4P1_9EUKA